VKEVSKREKVLICIALILVVLCILQLLVIKPAYDRLSLAKDKLSNLQREIEKFNSIIWEKETLQKSTQEKKKRLEALFNKIYLFPSPEIATSHMLQDIERIAKNNNIRIQTRNPQKPKRVDEFSLISIRLNFVCSQMDLIRFLHKIYTTEKLYNINYLNIIKDENTPNLKVNLIVISAQRERV
jgi:Tfp pilus assembly protein PilO